MNPKEKVVIYYFSATGNSLKAALDIASYYQQSEVKKITRKNSTLPPTDSTMIGFIFPVYMGGLPKIVSDFLRNFPFRKDIYYFSVATYYTYKGSTLSVVDKILHDRGIRLNYGNYIPTVGNCLKEYEVPASKRPAILAKAERITKEIVEDVKRRTEKSPSGYCRISDKLHKGLFNLFFKNTYRKFIREDTCTGCGLCSKVCPVNNISIKTGKPEWGRDCESCHACVHWCPRHAINIGKSKRRLQYHHPDIKINALV